MAVLEPLAWLLLVIFPVLAAALVIGRRARAGQGALRGSVRPLPVAALRSALIFSAVGPPLGAVLLLAGVPWSTFGSDPDPAEMVVFVVLMSYVPGLVPAFVGGACMGASRRWLQDWQRPLVAALFCGPAAALFAFLLLDEHGLDRIAPPLLLGAVAGACVEAALVWRDRRRRMRATPPVPPAQV